MPLARQQRVIDYMRSQLHPPPGVSAALAGLPVLAAQADATLSSAPRRLLTLLAGLIAVALVLLLVLRDARRALTPLIPIAFATGWSALIVYATGIPLNPMSATLGALVIAVSTEFSVLLSERYRQERRRGREPRAALAETYRRTGVPVLASAAAAIAGFGVLTASSIVMLRDFGLVTLIDLSVSLAGVMFVLPSALALTEPSDLDVRTRAVGALRRAVARVPRPRRQTRVA
jgi:predicted RND superfamily exporter protein